MNAKIRHAIRLSKRGSFGSLGVAAAGLVLAACNSLHVGSDYDRAASFDHYQTYAWLSREHQARSHPIAVQAAHAAIDSELSRKGYTRVDDPAGADFVVDSTIGARDRADIQAYPVAYRGPWMWDHWYRANQIDVHQYREGTLAIDVFDGQSQQAVWSGWAKKELLRSDQENSEKAIGTATAAVLSRFPPQ
jgi:hypothetical protein